MNTLAGRLHAVKMKTGGSREILGWEQATGVPQEVLHHVTGLNRSQRRILAEIAFALTLPGNNEKEISAAIEILEKAIDTQGALNIDACKNAESALLPLKKTAKEYSVIFAAHAHIDMNWMWSWHETVQSTLATFRTMLTLMNEYPKFSFSQSQASCYKIVEEFDPDLMREIKKRIAEGRWEVTASSWVETDKNMPCSESLIRHIKYTKNYLKSSWGINPDGLQIDFSPDTFGHSAFIPEIDSYGGVKYMYHCRGLDERKILYRWKSPSGSEILVYCEPNWYNRGIQDEIALGAVEASNLCGGLKTSLVVYGVGDHGGGPTRRDVERIIEMQEWPVYPELRFGNFLEFYNEAEKVKDKLPVVEKEINFAFSGCYTTQSRIKMGNRKTEAALLDAEFLDSMSSVLTGKKYPKDKLELAWQKTLFNHFHDIITGSCVRDSRDHAMANFSDAQAVAGTAREKAGTAIALEIDTSAFKLFDDFSNDRGNRSEGAGSGFGLGNFGGIPVTQSGCGSKRIFHVFNPSAVKRRELVEFVLWDWDFDCARMEICDSSGKNIPFQIHEKDCYYWDHRFHKILAFLEIPAGGYTTIILQEKEYGGILPVHFMGFPRFENENHGNIILENEFIKAEFKSSSGALCSLVDKKTGKEKIAKGKKAGLVVKWAEKATNNAWLIGRYLGEEVVEKTIRLQPKTGNPLRNVLEIEQEILNSKIKTIVSLDEGSKALSFGFSVDWNEAAKDYKNIPVLCFTIPLEDAPETFKTDVPLGIQERKAMVHDVPALQYIAAINGSEATALISDCKYGYKAWENSISVTLINSSSNPDPYPERGEHAIKLWLALEENNAKTLYETAFAFCHPVSIVTGTSHKGSLPPEKELLRLDAKSTVLSSSGIAEDGDLLLRLYETSGKKDSVIINLPLDIEAALFVDLVGNVMTENTSLSAAGNTLQFEMQPYKLAGLKVKFK